MSGDFTARPGAVAPASRWRTRRVRPGRRALALGAGLTAAVLATAGCATGNAASTSGGSGSAGGSSVTLNIGDQKGTGAEAVLKASGLLSKLPFTVHWTDFTSGPPMMQAMGTGAVDVGGVGDSPPVFAAAGGDRVALVGARSTPPQGSALVVPQKSGITSISQLRGKKIAVAQGSSSQYHLLTVLRKAGLTPHDVTLDYLQPAEGLAAVTSGAVDAWDVWSPYVEQVTVQDHARELVNGNGYGSNYAFEVASRDALGDHAKATAIREYLKILNQAYAWTAAHPQAWASAWAQATGLPQGVMLTAAKDSVNVPTTITPAVVSSEQQLADTYAAAGLIPDKVEMTKYTVTTFNDTVGGAR